MDNNPAAETVMFRIAQAFGNSIDGERWHADLLRRFRHFKRYYYRIEYDWDKLDFLIRKLQRLHPRFVHELNAFREFAQEIERG